NDVEMAHLVNRLLGNIPAGLVRRAENRHRQINAIQAAWIAYIGDRRAKRHREAAADQNPVQERIIVDDENMLNWCRENGELAPASRLTQCGCHRAHLVVAHNAFVATQRITDLICRADLDPSSRLPAWQRRPIHDEDLLTEVRR